MRLWRGKRSVAVARAVPAVFLLWTGLSGFGDAGRMTVLETGVEDAPKVATSQALVLTATREGDAEVKIESGGRTRLVRLDYPENLFVLLDGADRASVKPGEAFRCRDCIVRVRVPGGQAGVATLTIAVQPLFSSILESGVLKEVELVPESAVAKVWAQIVPSPEARSAAGNGHGVREAVIASALVLAVMVLCFGGLFYLHAVTIRGVRAAGENLRAGQIGISKQLKDLQEPLIELWRVFTAEKDKSEDLLGMMHGMQQEIRATVDRLFDPSWRVSENQTVHALGSLGAASGSDVAAAVNPASASRVLEEALQKSLAEGDADKLDKALTEIVRRRPDVSDQLSGLIERCRSLRQAVSDLRTYVEKHWPERAARPKPVEVYRRLIELESNLESLREAPARERVHLWLGVDFSLRETSRQTLLGGIAESLKHMLRQLEEPAAEFGPVLEQLGLDAATSYADWADELLDPERTNAKLQELLKHVFEAAGLQEIRPRRNDAYANSEHERAGTRAPEPSDAPGAVARTLHRGFRTSAHLLRKATVEVFG